MSNLRSLVVDAKVDDLHMVVKQGSQKYLCFTCASDNWKICVTEGTDVWKLELDVDEIESYKDIAEVNTIDAFLSKFRKGFIDGDLSVAMIGTKISLTVGKGPGPLVFDLFEAKAADRKTELQNVLFRLADTNSRLQSDLAAAEKTVERLKTQKGQGTSGFSVNDLGPKTSNQAKVRPKKTGMSAINPQSKKRKAASGVVWD